MKLYKVVTHTPVTFVQTHYIYADDEEGIRQDLDKNMKSDPSIFIESHNYTIGDYELEDVELKCR